LMTLLWLIDLFIMTILIVVIYEQYNDNKRLKRDLYSIQEVIKRISDKCDRV